MTGEKDATALPVTTALVAKKIGRPRLNRTAEEKKALRREYLRKYRAGKREPA